jgi:hypothetical protein
MPSCQVRADVPGSAPGAVAESELYGVIADRDEAGIFGTLVGRAQAQLLVETSFCVRVGQVQDWHELGDQVAHGPRLCRSERSKRRQPRMIAQQHKRSSRVPQLIFYLSPFWVFLIEV